MNGKVYVVIANHPEESNTFEAYIHGVFSNKEKALEAAAKHLPPWLENLSEEEKKLEAVKFVVEMPMDQTFDNFIRVGYYVG